VTVAATLQSPVLFTIADVRLMHLLTEVNEAEVGSVQPGSDVSFQVESMGPETFHGKVADVRLQPCADQAGAIVAVATTGSGATPGGLGRQQRRRRGEPRQRARMPLQPPARPALQRPRPGLCLTAVVDVENQDGGSRRVETAIVTMSGDRGRASSGYPTPLCRSGRRLKCSNAPGRRICL
jgi:hypothetical protein